MIGILSIRGVPVRIAVYLSEVRVFSGLRLLKVLLRAPVRRLGNRSVAGVFYCAPHAVKEDVGTCDMMQLVIPLSDSSDGLFEDKMCAQFHYAYDSFPSCLFQSCKMA